MMSGGVPGRRARRRAARTMPARTSAVPSGCRSPVLTSTRLAPRRISQSTASSTSCRPIPSRRASGRTAIRWRYPVVPALPVMAKPTVPVADRSRRARRLRADGVASAIASSEVTSLRHPAGNADWSIAAIVRRSRRRARRRPAVRARRSRRVGCWWSSARSSSTSRSMTSNPRSANTAAAAGIERSGAHRQHRVPVRCRRRPATRPPAPGWGPSTRRPSRDGRSTRRAAMPAVRREPTESRWPDAPDRR